VDNIRFITKKEAYGTQYASKRQALEECKDRNNNKYSIEHKIKYSVVKALVTRWYGENCLELYCWTIISNQ
jgi:hypothetical protein